MSHARKTGMKWLGAQSLERWKSFNHHPLNFPWLEFFSRRISEGFVASRGRVRSFLLNRRQIFQALKTSRWLLHSPHVMKHAVFCMTGMSPLQRFHVNCQLQFICVICEVRQSYVPQKRKKKHTHTTLVKCVALRYYTSSALKGSSLSSLRLLLASSPQHLSFSSCWWLAVRNCQFKYRCDSTARCSLCENNNVKLQMSHLDSTVRTCCSVIWMMCCLSTYRWTGQQQSRAAGSVIQQSHPVCLSLVCCGWVLKDMMHIQ